MKGRLKISSGHNQMRWMVLLLAIAVILPTVCLLWFMNHAVKNERLVVRQKLIDSYQSQLHQVRQQVDGVWSGQIEQVEKTMEKPIPDVFESLVRSNAASADGVIIYDNQGRCIYPARSDKMEIDSASLDLFEEVWSVEFVKKDVKKAFELYEGIAAGMYDVVSQKQAMFGQIRCLRKLGRIDEAIHLCAKIKETGHGDEGAKAYLRANAQLLITELYKETLTEKTDEVWKYYAQLRNLFSTVANYNSGSGLLLDIPSDQRVFLAERAFELLDESDVQILDESYGQILEGIRHNADIARQMMAAEELSLKASRLYPTSFAFERWESQTFRLLPKTNNIYAFYCKTGDKTVLLLRKQSNVVHRVADKRNTIFDLWYYNQVFGKSAVAYRVLDERGGFVAGVQDPKDSPFVSQAVSKFFPGWKIELYFENEDIFNAAASKQTAVYTWTGILVIVLILISGGIAGKVIGRQIKLNKLKNDFIANVSHELKTPLASIRVLVDTLLEGNFKDQKQAVEYLQLTSKENERLSRLIDNFLTFSRMERNKQAFDIVRTSPAAIGRSAVEAASAKFNNHQCRLDVSIADNLPEVLADHDAMVTVLVNLLDNAYKYSYDDKQIKLKVYVQNSFVCFEVADNGVGMSRRATKKIFKRFYQADQNLSRSIGGCGLGLSIVKFIVDAHKGQIDVDSKPDKGSTFIVKLLAAN